MYEKQYSKFLRILITSILYIGYFSISSSLAQISEGGLPSFQFAGSLRSEKLAEQVPVNFSVEDLKAVDAWRVSQRRSVACSQSRFQPASTSPIAAIGFHYLTVAKYGNFTFKRKGDRLDPVLLRFYIPKGARLYLYNAAKTKYWVPIRIVRILKRTVRSQAVAGDEVILEYVPAPSGETPRLRIREVGYGYNHLEAIMPEVQEAPGSRLFKACEVNINCEEGADWRSKRRG